MIKRAIFSLSICTALFSEPMPFVNPHPFSASHMNPVMEGTGERCEIGFRQTSYFDDMNISKAGREYRSRMDFESSELALFYRKKFAGYFFSFNASVTHLHSGIFDNTIIFIHNSLGLVDGVYSNKKKAPKDKFVYSIIDDTGHEYIDQDERWLYDFDFFLSKEFGSGYLLRLGINPPVSKYRFITIPTDNEYSLTLQKHLLFDRVEAMVDVSSVFLSRDELDLKTKKAVLTSNAYISYDKSFFVQANFTESVYERHIFPGMYGHVVTLGYEKNGWYVGFLEDISQYSSPDVSIMFGYRYQRR